MESYKGLRFKTLLTGARDCVVEGQFATASMKYEAAIVYAPDNKTQSDVKRSAKACWKEYKRRTSS